MYTIDKDLEIVVLEGAENVVVNNGVVTKKSGAASGEATIAVRYLQKIGNSTYYTYSRAIEIDALSYDHDHAWDTNKWESNDTHHWHPCTAAGCMETVPANMDGYAEHTYANDTDLTCDCSYVRKVAKVPAGYETDGLVLFLDGIDNVATGTHSNTSDVWVNLASIGQQIALPDGSKHVKVDSEWGSDYLDLDGYIKLPESVRQVLASGEFTIEFVMDDFAVNSVDTQNIMTLTGSDAWIEANKAAPVAKPKNDNFVIYQNAWESNVNFKINTDGKPRAQLKNAVNVNDKTNAITFKLGSKANWYQNASVVSTSNDTYTAAPDVASWDGTTPQVLFGAAVDTVQSRAFDAKVKAIRIYDRVLSADELTANAVTDDARYGQKLTGSNIPDGYAETGLVLFLDGLDNTGTGDHSTNAMKWVNLADRSEYATFLSGGSNSYAWNEDGMLVNGGVILPASALEAVAGANFTLEF